MTQTYIILITILHSWRIPSPVVPVLVRSAAACQQEKPFLLDNLRIRDKNDNSFTLSIEVLSQLTKLESQSSSDNKSAILAGSTVIRSFDEYRDASMTLFRKDGFELGLGDTGEVFSLDITNEDYDLSYSRLNFKINDSFSKIIEKLKSNSITYDISKKHDYIGIPFTDYIKVKGVETLVLSSKSLLLYFDREKECIESLRIIEWD